jgi:hypothetical protein
MNIKQFTSGCIFIVTCFVLWNCTQKPIIRAETAFTKADSVTDLYLAFQDNILQSWNVMINDDNQKIKAMHNLLHELMISNPEEREQFSTYEQRLDHLMRTRYTQKSMTNADVIAEYDFATYSLIRELVGTAEEKKEYTYNPTLQNLVNDIRVSYERTFIYRIAYDSIVITYNRFLEKNKDHLLEIDHEWVLETKPLFQVASTE